MAQPRKDPIAFIAELESTRSVKLIDEVEAISMVSVHAWFDKSLEEVSDFVCADVEFAAEVIVVLKPFAYSAKD